MEGEGHEKVMNGLPKSNAAGVMVVVVGGGGGCYRRCMYALRALGI